MNFAEAVAALNASDLGAKSEILAAIQRDNTERLEREKSAKERARLAEQALATVAAAAGATGEDEATGEAIAVKLKAALSDRDKARADLAALEAEKTTLAAKATELEGQLGKLDRAAKLGDLAKAIGAEPKVLTMLLADLETDKIPTDLSDLTKVKIGEVDLDAWKSSDAVVPFAPALFPAAALTKPGLPQLPTTPGGSAPPVPVDVYSAAVSRVKNIPGMPAPQGGAT